MGCERESVLCVDQLLSDMTDSEHWFWYRNERWKVGKLRKLRIYSLQDRTIPHLFQARFCSRNLGFRPGKSGCNRFECPILPWCLLILEAALPNFLRIELQSKVMNHSTFTNLLFFSMTGHTPGDAGYRWQNYLRVESGHPDAIFQKWGWSSISLQEFIWTGVCHLHPSSSLSSLYGESSVIAPGWCVRALCSNYNISRYRI